MSKCATAQELAVSFARFCNPSGLFIVTETPSAIGERVRFAVVLSGGDPVIEGTGRVIESHRDERSTVGRPGMRVSFDELDPGCREYVREMAERGRGAQTFEQPAAGGAGAGSFARERTLPLELPSIPPGQVPPAAVPTATPASTAPRAFGPPPGFLAPPARQSPQQPIASPRQVTPVPFTPAAQVTPAPFTRPMVPGAPPPGAEPAWAIAALDVLPANPLADFDDGAIDNLVEVSLHEDGPSEQASMFDERTDIQTPSELASNLQGSIAADHTLIAPDQPPAVAPGSIIPAHQPAMVAVATAGATAPVIGVEPMTDTEFDAPTVVQPVPRGVIATAFETAPALTQREAADRTTWLRPRTLATVALCLVAAVIGMIIAAMRSPDPAIASAREDARPDRTEPAATDRAVPPQTSDAVTRRNGAAPHEGNVSAATVLRRTPASESPSAGPDAAPSAANDGPPQQTAAVEPAGGTQSEPAAPASDTVSALSAPVEKPRVQDPKPPAPRHPKPVKRASATPSVTACTLAVASAPSRATVRINGKNVGVTPLAHTMPCGRHRVEVTAPKMKPHTRTVLLSAGKRPELRVRLSPQ